MRSSLRFLVLAVVGALCLLVVPDTGNAQLSGPSRRTIADPNCLTRACTLEGQTCVTGQTYYVCNTGSGFFVAVVGGSATTGWTTFGNGVADTVGDVFTTTNTPTIALVTTDDPEDLSANVIANSIGAPQVTASLDTRKCGHLVIENIAVTDEWVVRLPPFTGTMTRVDCESYSGTSFTIDICDGEDIGDDTCTTSVLGAPLVCGLAGAFDDALFATGFAARDKVSIVFTAQTGGPKGDIYITCTVD